MFYLGAVGAMLLLLVLLLAWSLAVGGPELSPLEALLLPALALLGAWSFSMWAVGSLVAFNGAVAAASLLALMLGGWWRCRKARPAQRMRDRLALLRASSSSLGRVEKASALFVALACALSLGQLPAPPSGGDYDSLVYHLAAPWQYIRAGHVVELPYDHHSYFPFGFEMLFAAPLSWFGLNLSSAAPAAGAVAAKILHWAMLPASALLLVAFSSRVLGSRRAGWLAALVWCSSPVVLAEASTAYIDLGLCAWALAAFHSVARALQPESSQEQRRAWMLWSGAFAGATLGCKYLGALYAVLALAWMLATLLKRRQFAPLARSYAGAVALMLLLGGGFYARNIAWTGSPVFPFAYEIFGGRGWDIKMAHDYARDQNAFGFGRSPSDLAWLPWRLSMTPLNALAITPQGPMLAAQPLWPFSDAPGGDPSRSGLFEVGGYALSTSLSPLLLALGLPCVLMRRKPAALGAWMLAFGALWVFWSATGQYARYLLPALALWSAACGWCADRLLQRPVLRLGLASAIAACCATALTLCALNGAASWSVAAGSRQPGEWLASSFSGWKAMSWINTNTPAGDGVAVWGEPRCLYLDRRYFFADDPHNNLLDYSRLQDWPALKAALKKLGANWVLWNVDAKLNGGGFGLSDEDELGARVARLIEQNAAPQFEARGYRVYRLD